MYCLAALQKKKMVYPNVCWSCNKFENLTILCEKNLPIEWDHYFFPLKVSRCLFWIKWCHLYSKLASFKNVKKNGTKTGEITSFLLYILWSVNQIFSVSTNWNDLLEPRFFFFLQCISQLWGDERPAWLVGSGLWGEWIVFPSGFACVVCHLIHFNLCCSVNPGKTCDSIINHCECNPCFNGGSCQNRVDGYYCHCPFGK